MNPILELTVKEADHKIQAMGGRRDTALWLRRQLLVAQWDKDKGRGAIVTALDSEGAPITPELIASVKQAFDETFDAGPFIIWFDYLLNEATQ
jgi:hypothetical protein